MTTTQNACNNSAEQSRKFVAALLLVASLTTSLAAKEGDVVRVGAGGYLRTRPQPCKPLPEVVHKTENFKKPVITGQWWSSLLWQQKHFSQPLFTHPLAAVCTESGLAVSYPGAHVHGNAAGIFGVGAGKDGDLKLGHSTAATFQQADCDGYSDWFVCAVFANGDASGTIFALYPHQWKYTTTKLTDKTYGSVRGTMKVALGETFATEVPIQGVLPMFPPQGVRDKSRMLG